MRQTAALATVLTVGSGTALGHAQECPAPVGAAPSLAGQDTATRLAFIRQTLADTARTERRFALGWSLSYVGLSVGAWAVLPFSKDPTDPGQRLETAWNSGTSALAALTSLIGPVGVIRQQQRLEKLLARTQPNDDPCATLVAAERILADAAKNQAGAHSARAHLGNFAVNVGLGLVLAYGLRRPDGAAINTTVGIALGELMIVTRPTQAERSLASYRAGDLHPQPPTPALPLVLTPLRTSTDYGLALAGTF